MRAKGFVLRIWRVAGVEPVTGMLAPGVTGMARPRAPLGQSVVLDRDTKAAPAATLLLVCHVDMLGLRFFRKKLNPSEPTEFGPNTLLFRLRDGWCGPHTLCVLGRSVDRTNVTARRPPPAGFAPLTRTRLCQKARQQRQRRRVICPFYVLSAHACAQPTARLLLTGTGGLMDQ